MSKTLELPDPVYEALKQAASACGTSPVGWIAAHLPPADPSQSGENGTRPKTLAEAMAAHIGTVHSGGKEAPSQSTTDKPGGERESLADALAGLIGTVHSGGKEALSQNCGERFTDYLVQKKREGRL